MMKNSRLMLIILICLGMITSLSSAQSDTPQVPVPPEGVDFAWWQDPIQGAFAVQIPLGWTVSGGMSDLFGVQSINFNVISPDGRNFIGTGTTPIEWGIILTPELEAEGWSDGDMVAGDSGLFIAISPFRTGAKAAQLLADGLVQPNCESYEILDTFDEEIIEDENGVIYSSGEAQFKCTINDVTYSGFYYATTIAYPIEGIGTIWTVDTLYSFFVLPNNLPIAVNALQYMLQTFHFNPEWLATFAEPNREAYAVLEEQLPDDTLLKDVVSHIISLSHQRMREYIKTINGLYEFDYEFLPLP